MLSHDLPSLVHQVLGREKRQCAGEVLWRPPQPSHSGKIQPKSRLAHRLRIRWRHCWITETAFGLLLASDLNLRHLGEALRLAWGFSLPGSMEHLLSLDICFSHLQRLQLSGQYRPQCRKISDLVVIWVYMMNGSLLILNMRKRWFRYLLDLDGLTGIECLQLWGSFERTRLIHDEFLDVILDLLLDLIKLLEFLHVMRVELIRRLPLQGLSNDLLSPGPILLTRI